MMSFYYTLYNIEVDMISNIISDMSNIKLCVMVLLQWYQIQITLFFPEIVHNNYMGIYKMNHRIT